MNWMCTSIAKNGMSPVCHMSHVCHMCVTCHRLLGYSEVPQNCHHQYFLSAGAVTPQSTAGAIPKGSVLSRWVLSVTAPMCHSPCSKALAVTKPQPEPSAAPAPSAHGPNIKITQKQHIKNRDMVRSEGREQWSTGDDPPLLWAAPARAVAEEQQWRSSTAAVPSCKVVNPWQKTQLNRRAWKSKDGITLNLH